MKLLIILLFPLLATAQNLPVNWQVSGTFTNPTIVITQDANNLVIRIGTQQKAVAKTAFTKLTVPGPVLDPKQSADYLALAKQFTDTMAELQLEKVQRQQAEAENDQLQTQYANAVRTMKWLDEQLKKDTIIQVRLSREMLITLPVRRP